MTIEIFKQFAFQFLMPQLRIAQKKGLTFVKPECGEHSFGEA